MPSRGAVALILAVLVLTPVGTFWCPAVRCADSPPGMQGYLRTERLLITVADRPWALLDCAPAGLDAMGPAVEVLICE